MKKCPNILGLTFDEKSLEGIEYIKSVHDGMQILKFSTLIGHLFSIFGGSGLRNVSNSGVSGVMKLVPKNIPKEVVKTAKTLGKAGSSELSQTSYSVTNANWEYFYKSFDSLDKIKRGRIETEAGVQVLAHLTKPKERAFWAAIESGCAIK